MNRVLVATCLLGSLLTGCTKKQLVNQPEVSVEEYNKIEHETFTVTKGDITPTIKLKLEGDDYEKKSYYPFRDGLKVMEVSCVRGDMVSAGDVLVTFKAEDLEENMKNYQSRIEEDKLLLEHYENLANIDVEQDYSAAIDEVKKDLQVQQMYLDEANATLLSYQIVAEGNGVVKFVSELLEYGEVSASDMVLTITYGTGGYVVDTLEDVEFLSVGDIFEATFGNASYEMILSEMEALEEGTRLHFVLAGDENRLLDTNTLSMTIEKPTLTDVLYVVDSAVNEVDGQAFVLAVDENGFCHRKDVTVLCSVDGYAVISEGLSEGEKVVKSNE